MENQNSVCYVTQVNEVKPIEGADKIEQLIVGGWSCIAQKGMWQAGDLVTIATTDAVLPQELAERLEVTNYLRSGNRVRTIKLRGVYSECLIIGLRGGEFVGEDMQERYGIYKYEPPIRQVQLSSGRKIKYTDNPNFGVYYKFPNYKNVPEIFTEQDEVWISRKIHGTNARYGIVLKRKLSIIDRIKAFFGNKWAKYEFVVGSHNVEKGSDSQGYYDTNVWFTVAEKQMIKDKLWEFAKMYDNIGSGVVLYGEIYGEGIQKGYDYNKKGLHFAAFDLTINGEYQNVVNTFVWVTTEMHLRHVEHLHIGKWSKEVQDRHTFNKFIEGTNVPHEGIVIKHVSGDRRKIAKVINPDYLIYSEKHNVGDSH